MSKEVHRAIIMAVVMACIGVAMPFFAPTRLLADTRGGVTFDRAIPDRFGDWTLEPAQASAVVNPVLDEMLAQLYSETLTRTYINGKGYRIMLSIAYGRDQRGSLQLHYPEVCYPAQGFAVRSNLKGRLRLDDTHEVPVRRLETELGRSRAEPVTYWTMIGNKPALGGFDKKRIEASYALKGWVPDGVLFRVSSIDADSQRAFAQQGIFASALIQAMPAIQAERLRGVPN